MKTLKETDINLRRSASAKYFQSRREIGERTISSVETVVENWR